MMKKKTTLPYDFVLDRLQHLNPFIRPMFGCYAVYINEKLVLILRDRADHVDDNGVWIATSQEHHDELRQMFPSMRSVRLLGSRPTAWQNLPSSADDFESSVLDACDLILKNDRRIGKVPKKRKAKGS